ncbi:hypothetical protein [Fibrella aquatilis]|uniref:Uncharacterized protein n=1 Tax=Fibrella aquatilis TaxID=2817059 RepID=A0A939G957_9BACT|nr:hypothetical protein [Fibrella aquatilis]MBO0932417.1 hypothetical protein [Fibrella aquatilis]
MTVVSKEMVKEALKELMQEEPDFFRTLLNEVASEGENEATQATDHEALVVVSAHAHLINKTEGLTKRQKLERIVAEDFAEYDAVFRKLA